MASLSANGTETARYMREETLSVSDTSDWSKTEYSFRSNGKLLKKLRVRFKPDAFDPKGRLHSYGWKVAIKKLKPGEEIALTHRLEQRGYIKQ